MNRYGRVSSAANPKGGRAWYACLYARGRTYRIDTLALPHGADISIPPILGPRYIGAIAGDRDRGPVFVSIDLRTGKLKRQLEAAGCSDCGHSILASLMSSNGSLAMISDLDSGFGTEVTVDVQRADSRGTVLLDSSTTGSIDESSLRLSAGKVTWVKGGVERSASIE